jgi:hypothetical protein
VLQNPSSKKEINLRKKLIWQNLHEITKISVEFKVDKHIFPKFFPNFLSQKKNQQNVFEKNHSLVLISM